MLKSAAVIFSALVLFCMPLGQANAQQPVMDALKGCSKEIKEYCSAVTPGNGRLVLCAKAHEDKLSSECIYAVNRAGYWVNVLVRTLTYVASQCEADALKGCSKEIKEYCSSVTPGDGRLVLCAKAHEDKLSSECIYAVNRAGYWVNVLVRTLTYVASQCEADALKFCPNVQLGEQRVLNCLRENKANLNKYCGLALQDVGAQ